MTGDALLDTPAMRDLMTLLWQHSNAKAEPAARRERIGVLFDSAGVLVYRADLTNPSCTPCRSACMVPVVGRPVAAVNTHPFRPGDLLPAACHPGDPTTRQYTIDRFGGASEADLLAFEYWGIPGYILDMDNVYAIPRGTTVDNASANIRRYPRYDRFTGCRVI
jgi:hypothetical protein